MTTYGGIIEKLVPFPFLSVVPFVPVNEPVEVSEVVFSELPPVVPFVPVKIGLTESVSFLSPEKELETVPESVHSNKIDGSLSRAAYSEMRG